jgi:predicted transcriptional regulator
MAGGSVQRFAPTNLDTEMVSTYPLEMAMTIRLPEELDRALDAIAEAEHVSKHALVLQGVELIVARRARRVDVDDAIDFVLSHDAELLRRLEDA